MTITKQPKLILTPTEKDRSPLMYKITTSVANKPAYQGVYDLGGVVSEVKVVSKVVNRLQGSTADRQWYIRGIKELHHIGEDHVQELLQGCPKALEG